MSLPAGSTSSPLTEVLVPINPDGDVPNRGPRFGRLSPPSIRTSKGTWC